MALKRILKWSFILVPILAWLSLVGSCVLDKSRVNRKLQNADGAELKTAGETMRIRVSQTTEGEITRFVIQAVAPDGAVRHKWSFAADRDMFGGGFVAAADLDGDGDREIFAWGVRENREAFYIDVRDGEIAVVRHPNLPRVVDDLGSSWHEAYVSRPMGLGLLVIPLVIYYGLVGMVIAASRHSKPRRQSKPREADDPCEIRAD
jgi:hypothetical protein